MNINVLGLIITGASFLLSIIVIIFQEAKENKKKSKESSMLTDEIINHIVRNTIQRDIRILEIDINILLDGFLLLKNVDLKCNVKDLMKMIYMKIYENEFVDKETKTSILNELEMSLKEHELYGDNYINKKENKKNFLRKISSLILMFIITLLLSNILISVSSKTESIISKFINTQFPINYIILIIILISLIYYIVIPFIRKIYYTETYIEFERPVTLKDHISEINEEVEDIISEDDQVQEEEEENIEIDISIKDSKLLRALKIRKKVEKELNEILKSINISGKCKNLNPHNVLRYIMKDISEKKNISEDILKELNHCYYKIRRQLYIINKSLHYNEEHEENILKYNLKNIEEDIFSSLNKFIDIINEVYKK